MDTLELFHRVYVAGCVVSLTDHGTLKLTGHRIPEDLRSEIKAAKPAIISALIAQGVGANDPGYAHPRQYVVPPDCIARYACRHLGPCSHFLMRRPCVLEQPAADGNVT